MLKNTFIHIPGIGKNTENRIWQSNIFGWEEFLENHHKLSIAPSRKQRINFHLKRSIKAYQDQDHKFFINEIPSREHWRVYPEFKDQCCFLDIETTGLSKHRNQITLIGLYDGQESKIFVQGKNMHQFEEEIKKYSLIITFNGKCFDLPFIQAKFPDLDLNKFHIDLRFALRELGFLGGLKRIERELNINRDDDLQDINGFEAVRLWYKYKKGDENALQLLMKYNQADIENLKILMDFAFDKLKNKHFYSVIQ
ncbi:MAG: ribonuclease H-like domain-containing protein [Nanoarchaeota archaeon]|nr:ribonuclease H-like domain-containing protein [Nanoarchaeota archaeon]